MPAGDGFAPLWASPPGRTIRDCMAERDITVEALGRLVGEPVNELEGLLEGRIAITVGLARRLVDAVGASVEFWMARDGQYWDDRRRVAAVSWSDGLPVAKMARLGWLPGSKSPVERAAQCLEFFGVDDVDAWEAEYGPVLAGVRFRANAAAVDVPGAVAAWLRQGERVAASRPVRRWDPAAFAEAVERARALTREKDPEVFVPALVDGFASAGVALVLLQAPEGCPVSGAARVTRDGTRLVTMSARYLADDHFWFTLMHESAHLLLHVDGPGRSFVESLDPDGEGPRRPVEEDVADRFASETLLPSSMLPAAGTPTQKDVLRLSVAAGVSPGVVVGQLQHAGLLDYSRLNHLKRRYRWDGPVLAAR